jgi:site-specific DNA-methyltransferase (adenine-specific)
MDKQYQIITGDCLEILPSYDDGYFDCCIADPPYNISKKKGLSWAFSSHITMQEQWDIFTKDDYFQFSLNWLREVCRAVKVNGNIFVFGSFHSIFKIGFILQQIFDRKIISQLVWYKTNPQPNITCRMFTESTEFIIWAVNNESSQAKNWTFNYDTMKQMNAGKQMRNVFRISATPKSEKKYGKHPAQKPEAILERLILAGANERDIIVDPFSGTGTTGVVAKRYNRRCVMIDNNKHYNEIARKRIWDNC